MFKQFLIIFLLISHSMLIQTQDLDSFLKEVSENNPEILAYRKLLEAKIFEARTGLTPSDPFVSFGYMPGHKAATGIKRTWSVSQSFSFPTKYLSQKRISRSEIILAEQEFKLAKLYTLLDAKQTLFDLIYNEKNLAVLVKRKESYNKLKTAWEKMVNLGEATIMEYNKIIMEFSSLSLLINKTQANIRILGSRLLFMNGNSSSLPTGLEYPIVNEANMEDLILEKKLNHPSFIIPEKEYFLSQEEVKLSRNESLPEFQVGYSSEMIPGESFTGPVAGLSIPLWSNSNKVKTASALADHSAAVKDAELLRLKSEVFNEYENMKSLKKSIMEISSILEPGNNKKYLDIALNNGEISLTTYFADLEVMYQIEDKLLELENEYNKSLNRLNDHELLKYE